MSLLSAYFCGEIAVYAAPRFCFVVMMRYARKDPIKRTIAVPTTFNMLNT